MWKTKTWIYYYVIFTKNIWVYCRLPLPVWTGSWSLRYPKSFWALKIGRSDWLPFVPMFWLNSVPYEHFLQSLDGRGRRWEGGRVKIVKLTQGCLYSSKFSSSFIKGSSNKCYITRCFLICFSHTAERTKTLNIGHWTTALFSHSHQM